MQGMVELACQLLHQAKQHVGMQLAKLVREGLQPDWHAIADPCCNKLHKNELA